MIDLFNEQQDNFIEMSPENFIDMRIIWDVCFKKIVFYRSRSNTILLHKGAKLVAVV